MKRTLLIALMAFAGIGGSAAQVKAETGCPPGQHFGSGGKFGRFCYPDAPGAAAPACTARHRVCKPDGRCAMVCN
jgi:hypothetical protein